MRGKKHSREELIAAIQRFHAIHKRVPRGHEFTPKKGYPSRGALDRVFGSFNAALQAAGFPATKPGDYNTHPDPRYWTRERIIEALNGYFARTGVYPKGKPMGKKGGAIPDLPSKRTIMLMFGSVRKACIEAEATRKAPPLPPKKELPPLHRRLLLPETCKYLAGNGGNLLRF